MVMPSDLDLARNIPAHSIIGQRIKLRRSGKNHVGHCPFHPDDTPSLYVFSDSNRFHCFGCQAQGDAIEFVRQYDRISFEEAVVAVQGGVSQFASQTAVSKVSKGRSNHSKFAKQIWDGARAICGTVAEQYLINRGLDPSRIPPSAPLRFDYLTHSSTGQRHPALISRLDDNEGNFASIQRTFLTDDGWKLPKVPNKMTLGPLSGNATKLSPYRGEIAICEGLEDGLSLQYALPDVAVWVAAGTGNLSNLVLPSDCRRVTLAADNDNAGTTAAETACQTYLRQGFDARTIHPDHQFKDFNEQLQKERFA